MRNEFEFIENLKSKYRLNKVGDDCAILPKDGNTDMVITADLLVEEIDFRLEWAPPELIGHKSLAVSLSDIAAMGARPVWAMLSLAVPENLWKSDFLDSFYEAWHALARQHDVELIGGDISESPDKLVIDSIVAGEVPHGKAILRSGAQVGDAVFVSGRLGGAAAGLSLLETGKQIATDASSHSQYLVQKLLKPTPQVSVGNSLILNGIATAAIDISDGLSSELQHLAKASSVGFKIDANRIPVDPAIQQSLKISSNEALEMAIHGGEDFELLFTVSKKNISHPELASFYRIGEVTANAGNIDLILDDKSLILEPRGYRHF